jgi:hypothetical protein
MAGPGIPPEPARRAGLPPEALPLYPHLRGNRQRFIAVISQRHRLGSSKLLAFARLGWNGYGTQGQLLADVSALRRGENGLTAANGCHRLPPDAVWIASKEGIDRSAGTSSHRLARMSRARRTHLTKT